MINYSGIELNNSKIYSRIGRHLHVANQNTPNPISSFGFHLRHAYTPQIPHVPIFLLPFHGLSLPLNNLFLLVSLAHNWRVEGGRDNVGWLRRRYLGGGIGCLQWWWSVVVMEVGRLGFAWERQGCLVRGIFYPFGIFLGV